MKKVLINASVASMIYKFNMNNIDILKNLGYQVDVACNFGKENPIKKEEIEKFKSILRNKDINIYETSCPRNIYSIWKMLKTYFQLKSLIEKANYDLIHTQSPIGGVICRLAARKIRRKGIKLIYTAHGFHFYKGSSIINWLIFYSIEKLCSKFTDLIITINKEDFKLVKEKFSHPKVEYIPGVGIDIEKFRNSLGFNGKKEKLKSLNIPEDKYIILSIGELNHNKNHTSVIQAISKSKNKSNICYLIAGNGLLNKELSELANSLGVNLLLLNYRNDIIDLLSIADLFIHPSYREGLPVSVMEAIAAKRIVLASNIRGNVDLVDKACLFEPSDIEYLSRLIDKSIEGIFNFTIENNYNNLHNFDCHKINQKMKKIYENINYL
ncbi:glycosyltransferase [Avibacterium avium]|uniref:glycosyltransferase n=1 Tax=Avibacterium avium TaxID=751 RepID=UPI0039FD50F2